MKKSIILGLVMAGLATSCSDKEDNPTPSVIAPVNYVFERNGLSTVSFNGQTTRIQMAGELIGSMKDFDNATEELLLEMFRNETASGGDANPYSDSNLNASEKSVKSKVADSYDYYSANTTEAFTIKETFESWLSHQITEVFPNEEVEAVAGTAGQIANGTSTRYISAKGLEYNQAVNKALIGALMLDQILNNYLSSNVLDQGSNVADNNTDQLETGKSFTTMEHKWDEAYGYLYGTSVDPTNPNATIGEDDKFLNHYLGAVNEDPDFSTFAAEIFDAFKLGRAAIVAKNYTVRDQQIQILREKLSEVVAIRAVHYLQKGKNSLNSNDLGGAFHALSEAYGFMYSLRFTRIPNGDVPYFGGSEVDEMLEQLMSDGANGFWDVKASTLETISNTIANRFNFTLSQAAE